MSAKSYIKKEVEPVEPKEVEPKFLIPWKKWGGKRPIDVKKFPPLELTRITSLLPTYYHFSKDVLHQKYVVERRSITEISKEFMSSKDTVLRKLKEFNIPTRKKGTNMKKKKGYGLAYGKRIVNRQEVAHKREQENIEKMKKLRDQGFTYRKIAEAFNTMEIPTQTQRGKWHGKTIQQILMRVST